MRCYRDESSLDNLSAYVALGMFDGVHRGHEALLSACVQKAKQNSVPSVIYTYNNSPHPKKQSEVQGYLTTEEEKLGLCEKLGIDFAISKIFTPEYKHMLPESFVELMAKNRRVGAFFCGADYRFGHHGAGDANLLKSLCYKRGIGVEIVDDVLQKGEPISSTRIRAALINGDCELAADLLGRPYSVFVRFERADAVWPQDKARLAPNEYGCSLMGREINVLVSDKGSIRALSPISDGAQGELQFLRQIGHA